MTTTPSYWQLKYDHLLESVRRMRIAQIACDYPCPATVDKVSKLKYQNRVDNLIKKEVKERKSNQSKLL